MCNRYSVGSFSLLSAPSEGQSVDSSFTSGASASSSGSLGYEIESDVGRQALKEICCSGLSRMLDFPDNQLETLLGYEEENSSSDSKEGNIAKNISSSLRSVKRGLNALYHHHTPTYHVAHTSCNGSSRTAAVAFPSLTFGSPLSESSYVVLLQLISHMNRFVSSEGLFRKSGNKNRMEQLVKRLQGGKIGEVVLDKMYNAHDFASVLKQYFSELPEPLLLKRHHNAYIQAIALSSPASILHCLQLLMLLLQPTHRVVLQHFLDLLFQVTRSPNNKMDSHNLSLILAPTLFLASRSESLPSEYLEKLFRLLSYMIENSDEIFEVPSEVQVVADRYCKKMAKRKEKMSASASSLGDSLDGKVRKGEDEEDGEIVIDVYSTSCKRQCSKNYHEIGKENAMVEVADLYEIVKNMPEGHQKAYFMKKFESASKTSSTPSSVVRPNKQSSMSRLRKSLRRNKENATPKICREQIQLVMPCFAQGSLISEFDKAEDCAGGRVKASGSITTTSTSTTSIATSCNTKDMFKTPATPSAAHTSTISCHTTSGLPPPSPATVLFKTPKPPNRGGKFIHANSPLVTDN